MSSSSINSWWNWLPTLSTHDAESASAPSRPSLPRYGKTTPTTPNQRTRPKVSPTNKHDASEKQKWRFMPFLKLALLLAINGLLVSLASISRIVAPSPYVPSTSSYLPNWWVGRENTLSLTNSTAPSVLQEEQGNNSTTNAPNALELQAPQGNNFKIIILSMDRFESLKRLIRSLQNAEYGEDTVELVVRFDLPKQPTDAWRARVENFHSNVTWNQGPIDVSVATQNMGLRQAWLSAWRPTSQSDQAVIFEDDIEVSPIWYRWLQGAVQAYHNRTDVAGISLQRQTLVPHKAHRNKIIPENNGLPFLYKLVGSIGYVPVASKWLDFLDFAECALATKLAVETPALVTSDWYKSYDQRGMWTQLFIYFCDYMNLYTLYAFPPGGRALAAHWREKGEHFFGKSKGPDFALVASSTASSWKIEYPDNLPKLDWDAQPSQQQPLRSVVLSAAVGYEQANFVRFATNIRAHYQGEVVLLVRHNSPPSLFEMLDKHGIRVVKTEEAGGKRMTAAWSRLNTVRWQFYQDNCQHGKHDLCMAVDFQDSLFQDDPFRGMLSNGTGSAILHLYEHNLPMNQWHLQEANGCLGNYQVLKGKTIINAGGIITSPFALPLVAQWIGVDAKKCDEQVALNMGVYGINITATVIAHAQGEGGINNVAYGGKFRRDSRQRFLNHNCFPSPVVHQFDLIK